MSSRQITGRRGRQRWTRRRLATFLAASSVVLATIALAIAGCGGSSSSASDNQPTAPAGPAGIQRPSPGTVKVFDSLGDTATADGTPTPAPKVADITDVSISRQGTNLVFVMNVAGQLPDTKPSDTGAAEWGFLIDTNADGKPDWGIYADLPPQISSTWTWGLYDQNTKTRLADAQFPGSFSRTAQTITFTIDSTSFGAPQTFKWMAYTDDQQNPTPTVQDPVKAGDKVPDNSYPNGPDWIDFP